MIGQISTAVVELSFLLRLIGEDEEETVTEPLSGVAFSIGEICRPVTP